MPTIALGIDARRARDGAGRFVAATKQVERGAKGAAFSVDKLDREVKGFGLTASRVKTQIGGLFAGITAAFVARDAVNVIGGFEETLGILGGVARATDEEFQQLKATARELGATTRFTAQEAGEGLLFLARAGFDTKEALAAIPATLNLASVGQLELGESADIASNVVKQFGLAAGETARVVDVLTITSNRSNTDIRQLAEALKLAGPVANATGADIEKTAAAIGALGDAGVQASLAGTNLRGIILGLTAPTSEAKSIIEDMGIALEDVNPATNDLVDVFKQFRDAGLDAAEAGQIFGRRNAAAALILADSTDKMTELTQANRDFRGETDELAEILNNTLPGAFRTLRSAIEDAFLSIGDRGFGGAVKDSVIVVTETVRILSGLDGAYEDAGRSARFLAEAIKVTTVALTAYIAANAVGSVIALSNATLTATRSFAALNAVIAANPIGAVATAITAASSALFFFRKETVTLGNETASVGDFVVATWEFIRDNGAFAFQQLVTGVGDGLDAIAQAYALVTETIATNWQTMNGVLVDGSDTSVDEITGFIKDAVNFILGGINAVINLVGLAIENIGTLVFAFAELDFTSFNGLREGAARAKEIITGSLSPDALFGEIESVVDTAFSTDYVEGFRIIGEESKDGFLAGFEALDLSNPLEGFEIIFDDIGARAGQRFADRFASNAADALATFNSTVLPALFGVGGGSGGTPFDIGVDDIDLVDLDGKFDETASKVSGLQGSITDLATSAITDFENLGDSVSSFLESLSNQILNNALQNLFFGSGEEGGGGVLSSLTGFFTSLFAPAGAPVENAKGNVFSGGNVMAFAGGGIIDQPTFFPMGNGNTGLMGEQGPEAIMPLQRDGAGRLGVSGGGQTNISFNVTAQDANSFRRAQPQIVSDLRRATKVRGG